MEDGMERKLDAASSDALKQRAVGRLLRWGFSPACVAQNTGLSRDAVYRIRRRRRAEIEEDVPAQAFLGLLGGMREP
jgi:hypothetical protein